MKLKLSAVSLEQSYDWDPASLIDGIGEDAVLGVEAPTWTEKLTSLDELDHMMFPRIAPLWEAQGIGFHRAPGVDWR